MAFGSGYPSLSPEVSAFFADRQAQAAANGGHLYGGGPGDIGWGPGVAPPSWSFDQGTPGQLARIAAVANNPNLLHGMQSSPIPQWQIDTDIVNGHFLYPPGTPQSVIDGTPGASVGPAAPNFQGPPQVPGGHQPPPHWLGPPVPAPSGGGGGGGAPKQDKSEARMAGMDWKARQQHAVQTLARALSSIGTIPGNPEFPVPGGSY